MTWAKQSFENRLDERLATLGEPLAEELQSDYIAARTFVTTQIANYIGTAEPDLTDHSAAHLADVMGRAESLLGSKSCYFTPHELYLLYISILFHDVGNLHGRQDHQRKIATAYDACRKRDARFATERTCVLDIAGAHTGAAKDGSKDTLNDLSRLSFRGQPVRSHEVAATLRLADELAEGVQRTSAYMLNHGMYQPESVIFHKYASTAEYCIDRNDGRIALTFVIDVEQQGDTLHAGNDVALEELLRFVYGRVTKVDQERRYCKHYCQALEPFKQTAIWFNLFHDGQRLDLSLDPIVLSDLVVPGEPSKPITDIDSRYDIPELMNVVAKACEDCHA